MKCFILFSITVALVCAAPLSEGNMDPQMNNRNDFKPDVFIKKANRLVHAFGEYMPAIIKKELTEMMASPEEVKAYCEFAARNAPNSIGPELWNYFKQNLPLSAPRIERILKFLEDSFNKISKPGQDYLTELYGKWHKFEGIHDKKSFANLIRKEIEEIDKYNALDESVKQEFNIQYPEIMKFINTPVVANVAAKLQALKGKSDDEIISRYQEASAELKKTFEKLD